MQTEIEMRQLLAGLALAKRPQSWLADAIGVPRPTLRNWCYLDRAMPNGALERIWSAMAAAGVERSPGRATRHGPGVRFKVEDPQD
jgi:hypothetical protein